ncbi:hypothetical protein [Terrihabitans soli]|nr:hypothetical protein [Terrihabitans soli]
MSEVISVPKLETISMVQDLLKEIATEIDLHYEDDDFWALGHTISRMEPAVRFLMEQEAEVPEVVTHVVRRYQKARQ